MSLTSLLAVPEVKARFKQDWPVPSLDVRVKDWVLVAPPISSRPALVGTAFDYVLRFHLQRLNPTSSARQTWVAENALGRIKGPLLEVGQEICATARERFKAFLEGEPSNDELLASSMLLAQLDGVFRSRGMLPASGEFPVMPEDISDLRQLTQACDWTQWRATRSCLLNPAFAVASMFVMGADADFQLDDTLYELKTVRKVESLPAHYHQLVGYSALNFLNSGPPITEVAIYFSRFSQTVRWTAPDWKDAENEEFILWLCRAATETFNPSAILLGNLVEQTPNDFIFRPQLQSMLIEFQSRPPRINKRRA